MLFFFISLFVGKRFFQLFYKSYNRSNSFHIEYNLCLKAKVIIMLCYKISRDLVIKLHLILFIFIQNNILPSLPIILIITLFLLAYIFNILNSIYPLLEIGLFILYY